MTRQGSTPLVADMRRLVRLQAQHRTLQQAVAACQALAMQTRRRLLPRRASAPMPSRCHRPVRQMRRMQRRQLTRPHPAPPHSFLPCAAHRMRLCRYSALRALFRAQQCTAARIRTVQSRLWPPLQQTARQGKPSRRTVAARGCEPRPPPRRRPAPAMAVRCRLHCRVPRTSQAAARTHHQTSTAPQLQPVA